MPDPCREQRAHWASAALHLVERSLFSGRRNRMSADVRPVHSVDQRRWSQVGPVWALLALLGTGAWIYTVARARSMGVGPGTMDMNVEFFGSVWVAMMA